MKTSHLLTCLLVMFLATKVVVAAEKGGQKNPPLISERASPMKGEMAITEYLVRNLTNMINVTEQPLQIIDPRVLVSCQPPNLIPVSPHEGTWIHVLVNPDPEAVKIIKSGKGIYPEGTIILKQKFLDAEAKQTEFYTGMRKREKGYNPEVGDWEFFTLDRTCTKVTARGKIDSCMDCHANWKETDFVSRKYLKPISPGSP